MNRKAKLTLFAVLIFLAGLLIGSLAVGLYAKSRVDTVVTGTQSQRIDVIIGRLDREVGLSAKQQDEMRDVLERLLADVREERKALAEELRPSIRRARERARSILTEEQFAELRSLGRPLRRRFPELLGPNNQ
jgi:hypothetical protein